MKRTMNNKTLLRNRTYRKHFNLCSSLRLRFNECILLKSSIIRPFMTTTSYSSHKTQQTKYNIPLFHYSFSPSKSQFSSLHVTNSVSTSQDESFTTNLNDHGVTDIKANILDSALYSPNDFHHRKVEIIDFFKCVAWNNIHYLLENISNDDLADNSLRKRVSRETRLRKRLVRNKRRTATPISSEVDFKDVSYSPKDNNCISAHKYDDHETTNKSKHICIPIETQKLFDETITSIPIPEELSCEDESANETSFLDILSSDYYINNTKRKTDLRDSTDVKSNMEKASLIDLLTPITFNNQNKNKQLSSLSGNPVVKETTLLDLLDFDDTQIKENRFDSISQPQNNASNELSEITFNYEKKDKQLSSLSETTAVKERSLMDLLNSDDTQIERNLSGSILQSQNNSLNETSLLDLLDSDDIPDMNDVDLSSDSNVDALNDLKETKLLNRQLADSIVKTDSGDVSLFDLLDENISSNGTIIRSEDETSGISFYEPNSANNLHNEDNQVLVEDSQDYIPSLEDAVSKAAAFYLIMNRHDRIQYHSFLKRKSESGKTEAEDEYLMHNELIDELMNELLIGASESRWTLSGDELNLLLLLTGISNTPDKISRLFSIYNQMNETSRHDAKSSIPNSQTFSILLTSLAMHSKYLAAAGHLCSTMVSKYKDCDSFVLDERTLSIGMHILAKRLDLQTAERLIDWAISDGIEINTYVYGKLLSIYKMENRQDEALRTIITCMKENTAADKKDLDRFLINAMRWPRNNRHGQIIPISSFCRSMLDVLDGPFDNFRPSFYVWRDLLLTSSKAASLESSNNWIIVHKCLQNLINHTHRKPLDHKVLELGLVCAEKMTDPDLAVSIIEWGLGSNKYIDNQVGRLVFSDFVAALGICIASERMDLADKIFAYCENDELGFPDIRILEIAKTLIAGYAKIGAIDKVENMLHDFREKGMKFSGETYAAYIHALSINGMEEKISSILDEMVHGSIPPTEACFTAGIMSTTRNSNWSNTLDFISKMKKAGIQSNHMTLYSEILANTKIKDKETVLHIMKSAVDSKVPVDQQTFEVCARFLLPDVFFDEDIERARLQLRSMGQDLSDASLVVNLNRSLRLAIVESKRVPNKMLTAAKIEEKCHFYWREAVNNLVQLIESMEQHK